MEFENGKEENKLSMQIADVSARAPSEIFLAMSTAQQEITGKILQHIDAYDLSGLKELLANSKGLDLSELYNIQGRTLLHSAAIKNEESILIFLLSFAVSFNLEIA